MKKAFVFSGMLLLVIAAGCSQENGSVTTAETIPTEQTTEMITQTQGKEMEQSQQEESHTEHQGIRRRRGNDQGTAKKRSAA